MAASSRGGTHKANDVSPRDQYLAGLEERARAGVTPEAGDELGDPQILHRRTEALLNELERESQDQKEQQQRDATYAAEFLNVPGVGVPWSQVLTPLLDRSRQAVAAGNAQAPGAVDVDQESLEKVFGQCEEIRNRVLQACNGADARSKASAARRHAVFNRPPFSPSKPAWENELRNIVIAINTPGAHQTPALLALVTKVQTVLKTLERSVPAVGGRHLKKVRWNEQVVQAQTTLALAVDELVQWAGAVASPSRNAAILRITNPKRRGDEAGGGEPGKTRSKKPPAESGAAGGTDATVPAPPKPGGPDVPV